MYLSGWLNTLTHTFALIWISTYYFIFMRYISFFYLIFVSSFFYYDFLFWVSCIAAMFSLCGITWSWWAVLPCDFTLGEYSSADLRWTASHQNSHIAANAIGCVISYSPVLLCLTVFFASSICFVVLYM